MRMSGSGAAHAAPDPVGAERLDLMVLEDLLARKIAVAPEGVELVLG